MPEEWLIGYGRSPECKSWAQDYLGGTYTISGCGSQDTVLQPSDWSSNMNTVYPTQIPPALLRLDFDPGYTIVTCCGNCSLQASEVKVYYFPENTTNCQYNQTTNSSTILPSGSLGKRVQSLVGEGSIAVVSGHTLLVKSSIYDPND